MVLREILQFPRLVFKGENLHIYVFRFNFRSFIVVGKEDL